MRKKEQVVSHKKFQGIAVFGYDGPINKRFRHIKKNEDNSPEGKITVHNRAPLTATLKILTKNGILCVNGSRRTVFYDEGHPQHKKYVEMQEGLDAAFGVDREFLKSEECLYIRRYFDSKSEILQNTHDLNSSKNLLLDHYRERNDIHAKNITLIDGTDYRSVRDLQGECRYRFDAETAGYNFIHASRDPYSLEVDNKYLAQILLYYIKDRKILLRDLKKYLPNKKQRADFIKLIDQCNEENKTAKEQIRNLKQNISSLSEYIEKKCSFSVCSTDDSNTKNNIILGWKMDLESTLKFKFIYNKEQQQWSFFDKDNEYFLENLDELNNDLEYAKNNPKDTKKNNAIFLKILANSKHPFNTMLKKLEQSSLSCHKKISSQVDLQLRDYEDELQNLHHVFNSQEGSVLQLQNTMNRRIDCVAKYRNKLLKAYAEFNDSIAAGLGILEEHAPTFKNYEKAPNESLNFIARYQYLKKKETGTRVNEFIESIKEIKTEAEKQYLDFDKGNYHVENLATLQLRLKQVVDKMVTAKEIRYQSNFLKIFINAISRALTYPVGLVLLMPKDHRSCRIFKAPTEKVINKVAKECTIYHQKMDKAFAYSKSLTT